MINKSHEIGKMVFDIISNYSKRQNDTKIAYFKYLAQGKSVKDFEKVANKLWNNIDHEFMDKQIEKLEKIVHDENVKLAIKYNVIDKESGTIKKDDVTYFKLIPESEFNKVEQKFKNRVIRSYQRSKETIDKVDMDTYLQKKLNKYDYEVNQAVAYFKKDGGIARYVEVSSYLSMLHNTNLTKAAWDTTIEDAERLGMNWFIIPPHPFSCDECASHQGIPMSLDEVYSEFGVDDETDGELIHPNCKCTLSIIWNDSQIDEIRRNMMDYYSDDRHEQYEIRQKVNSASLQRERIETDKQIASMLGNDGLVDKYNKQEEKLDRKIEELINSLPTKALKQQVEAINR